MLVIIDGKTLAKAFENNMTLEKAEKYLKEYEDYPMHPKYYQSIIFMKEKNNGGNNGRKTKRNVLIVKAKQL